MNHEAREQTGRVFTPFTVGGRFRIAPPDDDEPAGRGLIHLRLTAGAFGSGEHETTAACLSLLAALPRPAGAQVLDLGSGTGILAIAAVKLGAEHALCIDNDPGAAGTCRRNAGLNRVGDRIAVLTGTLADAPRRLYDLVLANIYGDILLDEAAALAARARPGARLILSGILHEQLFDVKQRYRKLGCSSRVTRMLDDFCALLLERR